MDGNKLEALNLLHYSPVDENGGVLGPPFPVVYNHLLSLDHVKGEIVVLAPHNQVSDFLPIGCLIIVGDQAVIRSLRDPVLRISMADVLLPTLNTWGRPVRKSRIQLQREVLVPGSLA